MIADTRVVVLRSGRVGLFAAGADMNEMRSFDASDAASFSELGQTLFRTIERLPQISVAFIDGDCFGGALDLAMAFDLRFSSPRSRFAHPGSRIGIVTGFGGTSRWRQVIPRKEAARIFLENEILDAKAAHDLGLVDRIFETHDESFRSEIERLSRVDVRFVRYVKELVVHAGNVPEPALPGLSRALRRLYFAESGDS